MPKWWATKRLNGRKRSRGGQLAEGEMAEVQGGDGGAAAGQVAGGLPSFSWMGHKPGMGLALPLGASQNGPQACAAPDGHAKRIGDGMGEGYAILQVCAAAAWNPGLHDYDLYGLSLTGLYALATVLTAMRAWKRGGWFWGIAAVYLLLLTLNKQLDLQTFLTQTGRCVARDQGWYGARRTAQADVTYVILGLMVAALALAVTRIKGNRLMVTGLALITAFVALRVLSFHHMDSLLQLRLWGQPLHRYVEVSSVLLLIYAAAA